MSQLKAATDVVIAKLAEIDREIADFDKIIEDAQAKKAGLLMVREALTPLVTTKSPPVAVQRPAGMPDLSVNKQMAPAPEVTTLQAVPITITPPTATLTATSTTTNTGFRSAVRNALRANPKGLKPAELIKALEDSGDLARYTGKVKPSDRVYSELYSLKQSKEISKRYGRYIINTVEAGNAQN
jgi:hypothetical protein